MGPRVIKSCWQADLQPDQSPFILGLGILTLQTVTPTPTPQMNQKARQVAAELVHPKHVILFPGFLQHLRDKSKKLEIDGFSWKCSVM